MPDTNEPKKKTSPWLIGCLGLIGVFILLAIIGSFLPKTPENQAPSQEVKDVVNAIAPEKPAAPAEIAIKITASNLMKAYSTNEIAADNQYKGKLLDVTGKVSTISKGLLDGMYVNLKTDDVISTIQCFLNDDQGEKAAKLVPDQQIEIQGRDDGKMMNVMLKECWIK